MNQGEGEEITKVYSAIGHPARKKIVEILGEKQRTGFKDLKDALNVSVGTVYFHLEALGDLIAQDNDRKYFLTDKGRRALNLIGSGDRHMEATGSMLKKSEPSGWSRVVMDAIFGHLLLSNVSSNPKRFIPEVVIILGLGAWMFASNGIEPIMMFYNNQPTWSSSSILVAEFLVGWLVIFALCELLSYVFYRRVGGELSLLIGTVFSLAPLLIPLSILHVDSLLNLNLRVNWLWINVSLLVLQAWTLCLLTATLSLAKGLKIEKAALISMIVMYFSIAVFAVFFML